MNNNEANNRHTECLRLTAERVTFVTDELIDKASKEHIADVARLLVLNLSYYQEKYGDVPQESLLKMVRAGTLDVETKQLLLQGMQNLVSALGEVMEDGIDGENEDAH